MKKTILFISYHPASLVDYDHIRQAFKGNSVCVLVISPHPYVNKEIIARYLEKFDHCIILPYVTYEKNILRGSMRLRNYLNIFNREITPILDKCDSFDVITDYSAYLPVNALLSYLRRHIKYGKLLGIGERPRIPLEINIVKTLILFFYAIWHRLKPIYFHKRIGYCHFRARKANVIKFKNSEEDSSHITNHAVFFVSRPQLKSCPNVKDTIVIFSDLCLSPYGCDIKNIRYKEPLQTFFKTLALRYSNFKFICKPHPCDNEKVMPGLEFIRYELYRGGLVSQMFIEDNFAKIKACYTVASTSVFYSAERGIPSYTIYKYLKLGHKFLKSFFEEGEISRNPFFCNISKIEDIGNIDNIVNFSGKI